MGINLKDPRTAKDMQDKVPRSQIPATPRRRGPTPRTTNGRVTKPGSSAKKSHKPIPEDPETPTRNGKSRKARTTQAIVVDDDDDNLAVKNEGYDRFRDMGFSSNTPGSSGSTGKREKTGPSPDDRLREQAVLDRNGNGSKQTDNGGLGLGGSGSGWIGSEAFEFVSQDFLCPSGLGEFDDTA